MSQGRLFSSENAIELFWLEAAGRLERTFVGNASDLVPVMPASMVAYTVSGQNSVSN